MNFINHKTTKLARRASTTVMMHSTRLYLTNNMSLTFLHLHANKNRCRLDYDETICLARFGLCRWPYGHTLTSGFDFQHRVSYWCSKALRRVFELEAWNRQTDGRTDRSIA